MLGLILMLFKLSDVILFLSNDNRKFLASLKDEKVTFKNEMCQQTFGQVFVHPLVLPESLLTHRFGVHSPSQIQIHLVRKLSFHTWFFHYQKLIVLMF